MRHCLLIVSIVCFSLMLSACIDGTFIDFRPNSDVFVSNNTAQNFTVAIQISNDTQLQEDRDWIAYSNTFEPYASKKLLALNRDVGFAAGQQYNFDIALSSEGGETVTLRQQVIGDKSNSDMRIGAYANGLALNLFNDRTLHRLQSSFMQTQASASEIAIQAKRKARFDDVFYALTPAKHTPTLNENAEQLSMHSYSIWALPLIAKDIEQRLDAIPTYIQGYDVVLLQEEFSSQREAFFLKLAKSYPYQTRILDKEGINIDDGGVITFSRFPIFAEAQSFCTDCADADCLADKGVNYAAVNKHGRVYHVFATHTASFDTSAARSYRQKQFKQMRNFALSLAIPNSETVIYAGDLNVNILKFPADYQNILTNLQSG